MSLIAVVIQDTAALEVVTLLLLMVKTVVIEIQLVQVVVVRDKLYVVVAVQQSKVVRFKVIRIIISVAFVLFAVYINSC